MKNFFSSAQANGNRRKPALLLGVLMAAFALAGCKSTSHYIFPRIEGRLLDAQTRQPVRGVDVLQPLPNRNTAVGETPKGGAVMSQPPVVRSGKEGRFVVDSESDFALFRKPGWYSVSLTFEHPAYKPLTATYTLADATNTVAGEPLVRAGDILLTPRAR